MLSDGDIIQSIKTGDIKIEPFDPNMVRSCSYDLKLGRGFKVLKVNTKEKRVNLPDWSTVQATNSKIVLRDKTTWYYEDIDSSTYDIPPHSGILATTKEIITLSPNICAYVSGRSSIGRLFLEVEQTAGFIEAGFSGNVTLELVNNTDFFMEINEDDVISQIVFHTLDTPCFMPYGDPRVKSRYQNQRGTTGSRYES